MKGILLLSHGKLAEGMKDSLELFSGEVEQLDTLELEPGQEVQDFVGLLREKIEQLDSGNGVTIFCDLAFGTPSNVSGQLLNLDQYKDKIQIVTGMNLPMLLEYTQLRNSDTDISELIQIGKDGIIDFGDKIRKK